jgi:hypothetical protein
MYWGLARLYARIGGGCTSFQCGLDVLYHAIQSADLQELELLDFQRQQEERDWAVPTRSRQNMVDDLASWWVAWPHAKRGKECLAITGLSNALPEMVTAGSFGPDGVYTKAVFALVGSEDYLISREAGGLWLKLAMGRERAHAMSIVQERYDRGELLHASDLQIYLEDESDPENELCEGIEVDIVEDDSCAHPSVPGEDGPPLDDDAFFAGGEDSLPAEAGGEAPLPAVAGGEAPLPAVAVVPAPVPPGGPVPTNIKFCGIVGEPILGEHFCPPVKTAGVLSLCS